MSSKSLNETILVAQIESGSKNVFWGGANFNEFIPPDINSTEWYKIHNSIKLSDLNLLDDDLILKVFVWNKNKADFLIDNFRISLRSGNPIIYGLFEKI